MSIKEYCDIHLNIYKSDSSQATRSYTRWKSLNS